MDRVVLQCLHFPLPRWVKQYRCGGLITSANPGQYGETWALQQNGTNVCTFWVIVNVQ